ncbi:MAG: glycosyltransferase family 39 protein, partial [Terriglobales bacterium]
MKRSLAIFAAGLMVRFIAIAYLAKVSPHMLSWGANEAGGIARWIVSDHSFSSPFHDAHGPTAWLGPVYPAIVAGIFLLLGVQTSASALAVMGFNAVCSAATGVIVYELGTQIHSERAGWFAGWIWELSPYVAILPYVLWDTALSALCFSGALLLTLHLRESSKAGDWTACGALWGVTALVNPALLTPLPVLAWLLSDGGRKWKLVCAMAAVTIVVIMPWTVRNYAIFDEIMPVRSNGLAEIYFANAGFENHPLGPSMEYQNLGEAAFTAQMGHRAIEYVRTHPVKFIRDSLWRALLFWIYPVNFWFLSVLIDVGALVGLMVLFKKSSPLIVPVAAVLVVYPLIYYASQVVSRYRHPIDPVLYALAGVALSQLVFRPDGHGTLH